MAAGASVTSGSDGISAVSFATTEPTKSTITVTASGTINSGANHDGDGNAPGGVVAGYYPNNGANLNGNVAGSVCIISDASITAAGGWGIDAFTFGTGNATVTTQTDSSVTVDSSIENVDTGIAAFALDGGNACITNNGTVTAATGIALEAQATGGAGTGDATIVNTGSVTGGVSLITDTGIGTFENEGAGQITVGGTTLLSGDVTVMGTGNVLFIGTNSYVGLAEGAGSTANATVIDGVIDASGGLEVGYAGTADLTAEDGTTITTSFLNIAHLAGSEGTVTITGLGTSVTVMAEPNEPYGDIAVGFDGTASLIISEEAQVTATYVDVGINFDLGVTDTVTVNDATLNVTQGLTVGDAGTGTVTIEGGATVDDSGGGVIGNNAGSTGTLVVTDAGSTLDVTDYLTIGSSGAGALTIENGATYDGGGLTVGLNAGSMGTLTVSGEGSSISITGSSSGVGVGNSGDGNLNVEDGATLTSENGIGIGNNAGSTGTLTVAGEGSSVSVTGLSSGVNVGFDGDGNLTVEGGASFTSDFLNIAFQVDSKGTVVVEGHGTTLTTTTGQYQNIGVGWDGTASLTVSDQAVVTSTGMVVAVNYGLSVTDTLTVNDAALNVTQGLTIGDAGAATAMVEAAGQIDAGNVYVASQTGSAGTLTVTGVDSLVQTANLTIGSGGSVLVTGGAYLDLVETASISGSGTLDLGGADGTGYLWNDDPGAGNNGTGVTLTLDAGLTIDQTGTAAIYSTYASNTVGDLVVSYATINTSAADDFYIQPAAFTNYGQINADANGGTLDIIPTGWFKNYGTVAVSNGEDATIGNGFVNDTQPGGATNEAGGMITVATGSSVSIAASSFLNAGTTNADGGTATVEDGVTITNTSSGILEARTAAH